ncbi:hypothetical protein HDU96_001633 [Phlyctochytrium bullatum]|nr:hypothetical protein HDU96_001633 [Phlyctochytrium bullatum]
MAPAPTSTIASLIATATSTLPATLAATATSTSTAVAGPGRSKQWYESDRGSRINPHRCPQAFFYTMVALGIIVFIFGYLVAIALIRRAPDAPVHQPAKSGKLKWYRWLWGFNKEDYPSTVPPENRQ